jgi:hypothetical protein
VARRRQPKTPPVQPGLTVYSSAFMMDNPRPLNMHFNDRKSLYLYQYYLLQILFNMEFVSGIYLSRICDEVVQSGRK